MLFCELKNLFYNIFFPQKCAFCEDISDNGTVICKRCEETFEKMLYRQKTKTCINGEKFSFAKKVAVVVEYNDFTSTAVLRLKNIGDRETINFFGELLTREYNERFLYDNIDIIIPVPMHKRKLSKKGFNHAQCIASFLAEQTKIPIRTDVLLKTKNNKTQHFLSEQQRRENILGVYQIENKSEIINKDILIVDDVMTTGSTAAECTKMLLENGAKSVSVLVIAATEEKRR
ncbi:MAG: ComF family protein [Oscillospiraceae bacterium]